MKKQLYLYLFLLAAIVSCQDKKFELLDDNTGEPVDLRATELNGVLLYTFPPGTVSTNYEVKLNNQNYSIYQFDDEWDARTYCTFQVYHYRPEIITYGVRDNVTATVTIKPKSGKTISSFVVRPKMHSGASQNYSSSRGSDGSIILTVRGPQMLCVEINGDALTPVLVFANKVETSIPSKSDCTFNGKCHYYEEGVLTNIDHVEIPSGKTVYIAPGAIVRGTISTARGASGVKICGRGIISGKNSTKHVIELRNATNCTVEGVTLAEGNNWNLPIYGGSGNTIDGVKIVSFNKHTDGIDIVGANNITVKNCFVMTRDDCIAIKSGVNYNWRDLEDVRKPVHTIKVQNCVIFNGIDGNALEIGCELNQNVSNITYENIDIIHALCPCNQDEGALSINNNGNYTVSGVTYKNIWLEDVQRYFLNIKVRKTIYSPGWVNGEYQYGSAVYTAGWVTNVTYENIYLTKNSELHSAFSTGETGNNLYGNRITGISFKNFQINSNRLGSYSTNWNDRSANKLVLVLQGVNGISFQ